MSSFTGIKVSLAIRIFPCIQSGLFLRNFKLRARDSPNLYTAMKFRLCGDRILHCSTLAFLPFIWKSVLAFCYCKKTN